jgi:hypothetical protein
LETPALNAAITEIEKVTETLRRNNQVRWVTDLEHHLANIRCGNRFACQQSLLALGDICHPKALGDASVTDLSHEDWSVCLDRMHDACARAFNAFE